jgi:HEAT repeat protein
MTRMLASLLIAGCFALQVRSARAEMWQDFAKWKLGEKPCMAEEVEKLIKKTPLDQRGEIEDALVRTVASADATIESRRFSCRMLQRIGTDKCVPVLARLLTDEKLSHHARLALQTMKDSAEAGSALRGALGRAPDKLKPGIIGSIAERRDDAATSGLAGLVTGADAEVAAAALNALGKIGGRQSLRILQRAQVSGAAKAARLNALLLCAEGLDEGQATDVYRSIYQGEKSDVHRAAALSGLARTDPREAASIMVELLKAGPSYLRRAALGCVVMSKSAGLGRALAAALPALPPDGRAELIEALAARGDASALENITSYLTSDNPDVRNAAAKAVAALGDATHVRMLLRQAGAGKAGEVAIAGLAAMTAPGVDDALIEALQDEALAVAAMKVLGKRECRKAAGELLRLAKTGSAEVKAEAWGALASAASESDMGAMMAAAITIDDPGLRSTATKAVAHFCSRAQDKQACFEAAAGHYDRADEATKVFILTLASATGGTKALELAKSALESGNRQLRDRALQSLVRWPDWRAAPVLMDLARSAPEEKTRILAVRGYISVADRERNERKRVKMYKDIRDLEKRVDEKKLIVSKLGNVRDASAIPMLSAYLDDAEVKNEAAMASVNLVHRIRRGSRSELRALMQKVMESVTNKGILNKAKGALKRLGR